MKTLVALVALTALQDRPAKRELKDRVEIQGTIVCVGCMLEKEAGADAQCTLHAKHAQGLKAGDGLLYTFLDNAKGHLLRTNEGLRGKPIKVVVWKYPGAQVLELSKYFLKEGDKWVLWDYCKTCGFEKGDNQDTDVCEDCRK
jgi:hypothetical protein